MATKKPQPPTVLPPEGPTPAQREYAQEMQDKRWEPIKTLYDELHTAWRHFCALSIEQAQRNWSAVPEAEKEGDTGWLNEWDVLFVLSNLRPRLRDVLNGLRATNEELNCRIHPDRASHRFKDQHLQLLLDHLKDMRFTLSPGTVPDEIAS